MITAMTVMTGRSLIYGEAEGGRPYGNAYYAAQPGYGYAGQPAYGGYYAQSYAPQPAYAPAWYSTYYSGCGCNN
jgi:hypothetical protein